MIKTVNSSKAFTIVELLVVIVVIGILAAITVVSYSGITTRAYNAKAVSIVDSYQKIFEMYKAENGIYPGSGLGSYCLGSPEDYPAGNGFDADQCYVTNEDVISVSTDSNDKMKNLFGGRILSGLLPEIHLSQGKFRGTLYFERTYGGYHHSFIAYIIAGDQQCAIGEKSYDETYNITECSVVLAPIKYTPSIPPEESGCKVEC